MSAVGPERGALSGLALQPNGHMARHRYLTLGLGALREDRGACLSGSMPPSSLVRDALLETGRIWRVQVVPVTPGGARGT